MRRAVGISLLTLVPGRRRRARRRTLRELCRALARVGELEYRGLRADASRQTRPTGCRVARSCASTAPARRCPGGSRAMARAAAVPGRIRRQLRPRGARRDPLPAQRDAAARVDRAARGDDDARPPARVLSRSSSRAGSCAYRRVGSTAGRCAQPRIVIAISEHARETLIERLRRSSPTACARSTSASTTTRFTPDERPREPFLLYPANALAAQEPRAAVRGGRARCGASDRELRLVLTGDGHDGQLAGRRRVRAVACRRTSSSSSTAAPSALVFPSLYEGFGQPVARGAGVRVPGGVLRPAARSARSPATRPGTSTRSTPSRSRRRRSRRSLAAGRPAPSARRRSPGTSARASTTRCTAS